jgi:hypothetical protein
MQCHSERSEESPDPIIVLSKTDFQISFFKFHVIFAFICRQPDRECSYNHNIKYKKAVPSFCEEQPSLSFIIVNSNYFEESQTITLSDVGFSFGSKT